VGGDRRAAIRIHALHWQLGNTPFERELRHREMLEVLLSEREVQQLMSAVRRGRPMGGDGFISRLEAETGTTLRARLRGRPPKPESSA
jgi:putative transposase